MEGMWSHFKFHTFTRRFVYRWHLTKQSMRACQSCQITGQSLRSDILKINCGHDGHVYKTNIRRLSIHSTVIAMIMGFLETYNSVLTKFHLHRLNGSTFYIYRQYTWYLKFNATVAWS